MTKILYDGLGNPKAISEDVNADLEAEVAALRQRLAAHKQLIDELSDTIRCLRHAREVATSQHEQALQSLHTTIAAQEKQLAAANKRFAQAKVKITRINKTNKTYIAKIKTLEHQLDYEFLKKKRSEVKI